MDNKNTIRFVSDDNIEIELVLIEQTKLNGHTYLLAHSQEDEETAYILKDLSDEEDDTSIYEFLEDEKEIKLLSKVFEELLDDVSIELE